MTRAFVFPGQGSQAVGMGRELAEAFPAAAQVFEEVDEVLGQSLSRLMFEGPLETLTLTENAQPALMAVSMAVVRVLETEGGIDLARTGRLVAGHSLGEYSALAAAGCFSLADAARLLRVRGRAMQEAMPPGTGAMAALLGADYDQAAAIAADAAQGEICAAANDNAPGQVVVSGHKAAVERAIALAVERGIRKAMMLPVSAPFHCALMAPAADVMAGALAEVTMAPPRLPVVANVTAAPTADPAEIRDLLVRQVTGTVRWRESVMRMRADGIETLIELGSGQVLTGLARRIDKDMTAMAAGTPAGIEAILKAL
jgi:[acyl-carrier-protein] S-malonyltransferase